LTDRKPTPTGVELVHHVGAGLLHVPVELDARGLEDATSRLRQLRPRAVAGNQCHLVGHGGGL
jgi:hypothetical protein